MKDQTEPEPAGLPHTFPEGPIRIAARRVPADWIDYNGHMNVARYMMAFDQAFDRLLEDWLGLGERRTKTVREGPYVLQSHMHYVGELLEGEQFYVDIRIVDCDAKRMHVFSAMHNQESDALCATSELMVINVDLEARKSTPLPEWAQSRLRTLKDLHAALPRPAQLGAPIGLRR